MRKPVLFVVLTAISVVLTIIATVTIFVLYIYLPNYEEILPPTCYNETECEYDFLRQIQPTCDSMIYCQGDLLHFAQLSMNNDEDSKYFVDLAMLEDEEIILKDFEELMQKTGRNPNKKQMQDFLASHFSNDSGLTAWSPPDFNEEPPFLEGINSEDMKKFAKSVNGFWKMLGRNVDKNVRDNPKRFSLMYVPNGFVVPGGRFREYYYWDSYWIIDGLLISNMIQTARGMLENFMWLIDKIGFIPNSGRVYHIKRSQPPLFTLMVKLYYDQTKDKNWLKDKIHILVKEAEFWIKERMVTVEANGKRYDVAIYNATTSGPRPEAYKEDLTAASICRNEMDRQRMYIELKSAAESGWDFSTRWIFDSFGGTTATIAATSVTRVAPVDLNAFLYGVFHTLSYFYEELGEEEPKRYWGSKAYSIKTSITDLMWNKEANIWYDYDIKLKKQRKFFYASNLTPLWTKAYDISDAYKTTVLIRNIVQYLKMTGIMDYAAGIPASKEYSGEQWDLPNAWPCLQGIVVEGLSRSGVEEGEEAARKFAEKWVNSAKKAYDADGHLYEKYDATTPGKYGGGGEYITQVGFGWTNGVILRFIKEFYSRQ